MNALQRLEVEIDYTNHRGERSIRRIVPIGIRFGSTEYHTELQWLMCANDLTKEDIRTFAMKDIHGWRVPTGTVPEPMLFSADSLRVADDLSRGLARKWKDEALAIAKRAGRKTVTADDVLAAAGVTSETEEGP